MAGGLFSGAEPHSGTTFALVGSTGSALLVLALALALVLTDLLPLPTSPLRAVGALVLSVYTAQIVVLWALLQVDLQAAQGVGAWALFSLAALAGAGCWRWKLGRGPLERLLAWSSTRAAAVEPTSAT